MTMLSAHVPLPDVRIEGGTPSSAQFDDVYFSRAGGIAETEHVFLRGNGLPQRWAGRANFTIAELGFGTGLNFLVTWREFLRTAKPTARLHYIAIEQYPLPVPMLKEILALQPELAAEAAELLAHYPLRLPGLHRIHFGRASLTLCYGDATAMLAELHCAVDAWYLDGFTPAKNPDMWGEAVMTEMARLSRPGTSVATFTAAGAVKRALEHVGFRMHKTQGYGQKRDMLVGEMILEGGIAPAASPATHDKANVSHNTLLVIGGGIAGCSVARAMAQRGWHVTLLEQHTIASGASGNAGAVLFPQLAKRWSHASAWYFSGYDFMLRLLQHWPHLHTRCGMLRLPRHAAEEAQLQQLQQSLGIDAAIVHWVEQAEASRIAGVELASGAAYFPQGTWLQAQALCEAMLAHPNISVKQQAQVTGLVRGPHAWEITCASGERFAAPSMVLANAHAAQQLLPQTALKLGISAGQVSMFAAQAASTTLRSILCHKGYVIPLQPHYLVGATYDHDDISGRVTHANHAHNAIEAEKILPGFLCPEPLAGRTSLRATTPDRLPYVGEVAAGLYVSVGHGSRGILSAPLAAEIIASQMCGEQAPVERALLSAVNPLR